jgi:hypothetical protein
MMVQATSGAHAGVSLLHSGCRCRARTWWCKAKRSQYLGCAWSGERQGRPVVANVCQFYIVHYDKVVKMAQQDRDLVASGIEQQIAGAPVYVAIALYAPLDAEQKAVVSLSFGERLHGVRDHAVEPAQAVAASNLNLAAPAQIADAGGVQKGIDFPRQIVKHAGREGATMQAELRRGEPGCNVLLGECGA